MRSIICLNNFGLFNVRARLVLCPHFLLELLFSSLNRSCFMFTKLNKLKKLFVAHGWNTLIFHFSKPFSLNVQLGPNSDDTLLWLSIDPCLSRFYIFPRISHSLLCLPASSQKRSKAKCVDRQALCFSRLHENEAFWKVFSPFDLPCASSRIRLQSLSRCYIYLQACWSKWCCKFEGKFSG